MKELDTEAWERWKAYRTAIRKPIKPASEQAMKLKLQRYGDDQAAVVDQSISNQWQGLFDLKKTKTAFGEKPVKTEKQVAADQAWFENCLLYTSPSPRDLSTSRMPSSA